ncbi:hypothetical protein [uncultured Shewanella sp.]|uniref:hypothetical protein n=1 Tax=uncultured Shewanella sp. TaxID=173975 RepID=UPI002621900A|nr:hypothetical protein [uncultured Shewanella sp.]
MWFSLMLLLNTCPIIEYVGEVDFDRNSSFYSDENKSQLESILMKLKSGKLKQVVLNAEYVLNGESDLLKYSHWLAERRAERVKSSINSEVEGPSYIIKYLKYANLGRRVTVDAVFECDK